MGRRMNTTTVVLLILILAGSGIAGFVFIRMHRRQRRLQRDLRDLSARVSWVGSMYGSVMELKHHADDPTSVFQEQKLAADRALAAFQETLEAERQLAAEHLR